MKLEKISELTADDAKKELIKSVEKQMSRILKVVCESLKSARMKDSSKRQMKFWSLPCIASAIQSLLMYWRLR